MKNISKYYTHFTSKKYKKASLKTVFRFCSKNLHKKLTHPKNQGIPDAWEFFIA
jgi:hypothetical protein